SKIKIGIIAIGENRGRESGLCLKCNDMSGNTNDFIVVQDENPPYGALQGIYQYQGDPVDSVSYDAPAGNTFSYFPVPADTTNFEDYNYFNNGEDIWYYHHKISQYFRVLPLPDNYTSETIELIERRNINYAVDSVCLSHLEDENNLKTFSSPRIILADADEQIALLTEQLITLIDGGNTEELNFEVMTSMPDDALEIRQELLDESPYLSDTVMKQAIYKENVLPNAMIRDILTVNPQSAKSDEVIIALDSRYEPMPDYLMAQIMEGQRILGAKELLEAKIQSCQRIRSNAKADLFRQFLNDTNLVSQADSIISFLEEESDLASKYNLAFIYWNRSETIEAFKTLNSITGQFNLTGDQLATHQLYQDYFNILEQMADNNLTVCDLDSVSVQTLLEIENIGVSGISAFARGMLVKGGFLDFIETITSPQLYSPGEYHYTNDHGKNTEQQKDYFKLFPNPAGDYVIVFYDIGSDSRSFSLKLVDNQGIVIRIIQLEPGKDQIVVNLENLPNGIYLFTLNVNGKKLESQKLIKIRN
ncbi:MAG TPA: T9SS type A sorting domain-containing protein, partial [Bacteroidales bacterium]|nr:T9SS type A sorting domain-containing protein [Bacteroidales bacterium]